MKYLFYSFQISISLHSTFTDVAYVIIGKSFKFSTTFVGSQFMLEIIQSSVNYSLQLMRCVFTSAAVSYQTQFLCRSLFFVEWCLVVLLGCLVSSNSFLK